MKRVIAVNTNCYHGYSIDEAIEGISKAGCTYIELTATKGWTEHVFPDHTFEELQRVKDKLAEYQLIPIAMSGHCNLMDKNRLQDFIKNIHLASFFGCKYIVSSIGEAHLDDKEHVGNQEVAGHLKSLLPVLEENDLQLVLEVHGDHGTGAFINEVVKLVDSRWVKIAYDTGNVIFYGGTDVIADMNGCIDNIAYIHVKDKDGEQKEWNFPYLGSGDVDFDGIFHTLKQKNNNVPFSIEIEFTDEGPKDIDEINDAVRKSIKFLESHGFEIGGDQHG